MREIKFRAWDNWNKDMVYLDNITDNNWYQADNKVAFANRNDVAGVKIQNKQLEIMQYTGLKDKNGKEIYEGDIYKYGNTPLEYREIPRYPDRLFHLIGERVWLPEDIEITGNIYENKELLK